jgi:hypothetical protein
MRAVFFIDIEYMEAIKSKIIVRGSVRACGIDPARASIFAVRGPLLVGGVVLGELGASGVCAETGATVWNGGFGVRII